MKLTRCKQKLLILLLLLISLISVVLYNKSYFLFVVRNICTPYDLQIQKKEPKIYISWKTIAPCKGYVRYKSLNQDDYSIVYPSKFGIGFTHKVEITKKDYSLLTIFIISNNNAYGTRGGQPITIY